ncbi:MAG TPA: hypothetical protein PLA03_11035, partial [Acidobacteriota bacterium]|nr:hypothetical protein [Acidobacteriota bacterium]
MEKKTILMLTSLLTLICCFSACVKRNNFVCVDGWYVKPGDYQDVKPVIFNNFTLKAGLFIHSDISTCEYMCGGLYYS